MGLARILQPLLTLVLLPARLLSMFFFPSEQPGFLLFLVLCCPTSATRTLEPVFFSRGRNNKKKELDEATLNNDCFDEPNESIAVINDL